MTSPNPNTPPPPPHHHAQGTNTSSSPSTPVQQTPGSRPAFTPKIKINSPFPDGLKIDSTPISSSPSPPPQSHQGTSPPPRPTSSPRIYLKPADEKKPYLPGQPRIRISQTPPTDESKENLHAYLDRAHLTKELDALLPMMSYIFVQTPSYRHIAPLHHQESRERKVIVDEHPGLHLVWYYQTIFIKPIPAYLFSPTFWTYIEQASPEVFEAALGFMRSYTFLIKYETDYHLACEKRLIPKLSIPPPSTTTTNETCKCCQKSQQNNNPDEGKRHPTYEELSLFLEPFEQITDSDLTNSKRFHYGELRLTRINRTAFFLRRKLAYFHIYPQWGSFLQHVLAPVITVFAVATVVLNSMQVSLAALDMGPGNEEDGWPKFVNLSKWFPIAVIILIAVVGGGGLFALLVMAFKDWLWVNKTNRKKRNNEPNFGEKSHGMIW